MTKFCGAFQKGLFFHAYGGLLGFWPLFWKIKMLPKYSQTSSIKPTNYELSNFKTKKKVLTTTAYLII